MNNQETSNFQRFSQWLKQSLLIKLSAIGFFILLLMIPNSMIQSLIYERQNQKEQAIQEVSSAWGTPQTIVGPVLTIPYNRWVEQEGGKRSAVREVAHFLPQRLDISGSVSHQIRQRGIFDVVLYQADLVLQGAFEQPDFIALHIDPKDVLWDQAALSVGISGMTGIKNRIELKWNSGSVRMEPGTTQPTLLASGVSAGVSVVGSALQGYDFSLPITVNGSDFLLFEPIGKETKVTLQSDWPSPSFTGSFLPDSREVNDRGFNAAWQVLDLNRNYPQSWRQDNFKFGESDFGVRFTQPVDEYAKNTRSAKYAILVIGLTFLIYFFFETLRRFHIHPFQYLLIGLALSVFYLLLLSLSEQIGFNFAYLASAVATIGLIVIYSTSFLKSVQLTAQLTLLLIGIYGFIFVVLQLEDYALLVGSLGIFAALAAVMFYSRKVDWYNLRGE